MPKIDLSWADTDTIQIFTASTKKELPNDDALMEVSSDLTLDDIYENNKRLFILINLKRSCPINCAVVLSISAPATASPVQRSVFDVLKAKNNQFPDLKSASTGNRVQFNVIVQYLKDSRLGVDIADEPDFTKFVEDFANLLWVIDPHYSKFKSRGKRFPKIVEDKLLNFSLHLYGTSREYYLKVSSYTVADI